MGRIPLYICRPQGIVGWHTKLKPFNVRFFFSGDTFTVQKPALSDSSKSVAWASAAIMLLI